MINNIDVTLRDGGYRNGFKFSTSYAVSHLRRLTQCGIEWIEVGYRNGSFKPIQDIGLTGLCSNEYLRTLHESVPTANLCVIAHPKNMHHNDIIEMSEAGVSMLRLCLNLEQKALCYEYAKLAKSLGMTVAINLTRVSYMKPSQVLLLAEAAAEAGVDVLYLADSNGSSMPVDIADLVKIVSVTIGTPVGIHAHDNLGLAMSISEAAVAAGATFVDSSLRGMGKGAGNLKLELWLAYLIKRYPEHRYELLHAFAQADELEKEEVSSRPIHPMIDIALGFHDLCVEDKGRLESGRFDGGRMFQEAEMIRRSH